MASKLHFVIADDIKKPSIGSMKTIYLREVYKTVYSMFKWTKSFRICDAVFHLTVL
jgi:hypothetical protein